MMNTKDTITKDELHANYKKLAKVIHPDLNHDNAAVGKFQELQEQYKIAQKLITKHYQSSISISLKEAIEGAERYFVMDKTKLVLNIPAGVKHRQTIQFSDNTDSNTAILHVKVYINLLPNFTIVGDHLILKEKISYWKLYFGGKHQILVPDGRKIPITIPRKTKNGKMFMVRNAGLFNRKEQKREPLYIQFFGSII